MGQIFWAGFILACGRWVARVHVGARSSGLILLGGLLILVASPLVAEQSLFVGYCAQQLIGNANSDPSIDQLERLSVEVRKKKDLSVEEFEALPFAAVVGFPESISALRLEDVQTVKKQWNEWQATGPLSQARRLTTHRSRLSEEQWSNAISLWADFLKTAAARKRRQVPSPSCGVVEVIGMTLIFDLNPAVLPFIAAGSDTPTSHAFQFIAGMPTRVLTNVASVVPTQFLRAYRSLTRQGSNSAKALAASAKAFCKLSEELMKSVGVSEPINAGIE